MKTTIIAALSLLITSVCFGHYLTPNCNLNGRFKLTASYMPIGQKCRIQITGGINAPAFDSTFTVKSSSFSFTVPQPVKGNISRVKMTTLGDNYSVSVWTNTGSCSALPLTFTNFSAVALDEYTVQVTVTVADVVNVDHINFTMKGPNDETFRVVATVKPEQYASEKQYTAIIKINQK